MKKVISVKTLSYAYSRTLTTVKKELWISYKDENQLSSANLSVLVIDAEVNATAFKMCMALERGDSFEFSGTGKNLVIEKIEINM